MVYPTRRQLLPKVRVFVVAMQGVLGIESYCELAPIKSGANRIAALPPMSRIQSSNRRFTMHKWNVSSPFTR